MTERKWILREDVLRQLDRGGFFGGAENYQIEIYPSGITSVSLDEVRDACEFLVQAGYVQGVWPSFSITPAGEIAIASGRPAWDPRPENMVNNFSVENNFGNVQQGDGGRQYN
jgi:hypothetical protein